METQVGSSKGSALLTLSNALEELQKTPPRRPAQPFTFIQRVPDQLVISSASEESDRQPEGGKALKFISRVPDQMISSGSEASDRRPAGSKPMKFVQRIEISSGRIYSTINVSADSEYIIR